MTYNPSKAELTINIEKLIDSLIIEQKTESEESENESSGFNATININESEVPVKVGDLQNMLDEIKRLRDLEKSTIAEEVQLRMDFLKKALEHTPLYLLGEKELTQMKDLYTWVSSGR
ncbi:hypothetical protein V3Q90_14845 [Flavobacterium oreochromis]|uniref:hypothetical protein n=1 Tax=Flavobacterium oreochromis TaxID=2906078 RepID=UPI003859AEA0